MEIQSFIHQLQSEFIRSNNPSNAAKQKAYLRNQFEFYGLTSPESRVIQKPFLVTTFLPPKANCFEIVQILWNKPQREYQYFAQELAFKFRKKVEIEDIQLFEYMILNKSWWDTVDFIAANLVGNYFKVFPKQIPFYTEKWLASNNMWLQRTAIIFQLKYKQQLDTALLSTTIQQLVGSKEFFINKAIGWALREYSKTNPIWVLKFVEENKLHSLSEREATRLLS